MRILFVSGETPLMPAGGIATYLESMVPALERMGHDVFLFTYVQAERVHALVDTHPFKPENVYVQTYRDQDVISRFPNGSFFVALSHVLAGALESCIEAWDIDVVEATDYQSPCLALFQRLQTRAHSWKRAFVTFNHGLLEVVFEADQKRFPETSVQNNLAERQQIRVSDVVVVPSQSALQGLRSMDIRTDAAVIREPYVFRHNTQGGALRNQIQYMGRLSIQKGVDKLIYLANTLHDVFPLRRVELIGRVEAGPFRESDVRKYVASRLSPGLRSRLQIIDYVPRDVALSLLESDAISPHLGSSETFSYSCIESIDAGQLPIVRQGTAMAEFYPEDLQKFVLDEQMRSVRDLQKSVAQCIAHADEIRSGVRAYSRETCNPEKVAGDVTRTYAEVLDRKRGWRAHSLSRAPATIHDVTVLIPAFKPGAEFMATVDSIAAQTSGIPHVLICDDGTPDEERHWFEYAMCRLPNVRIVRQQNAGLLAARNTLIQDCQTSLAIFLDADDLLSPALLQSMLDAWNESVLQPHAVLPQRRNFGESTELVLRNLLGDHLHFIQNDFRMTALIQTDILREIGFDSTRRNGEADDWTFWLDFNSRGYRGVLLPEAGFLYRFRRGSMSWPWSEGQQVGTQTMIREVTARILQSNPDKAVAVARALFALQLR